MPRYLFTSASPKRGGLFSLDTSFGDVKQISDLKCWGLTRGHDGAFYFVGGSGTTHPPRAVFYRYAPGGRVEQVAEHEIGYSHDLKKFGDYYFLVASLGNQIVRFDEQFRLVDRMQIVENDGDVCHVNSLELCEGSLYCTIFTLAQGLRREKRFSGAWHMEGKCLKLNWEEKSWEILAEPFGQPHSLTYHQGAFYLTESHLAQVTWLDPVSREKRVVAKYSNFVRGLCFAPEETLVGTCIRYRGDRKRLQHLPWWRIWQERLFPFAGVMVVDPVTWRVRRKYSLPETEVYDIRALDE